MELVDIDDGRRQKTGAFESRFNPKPVSDRLALELT